MRNMHRIYFLHLNCGRPNIAAESRCTSLRARWWKSGVPKACSNGYRLNSRQQTAVCPYSRASTLRLMAGKVTRSRPILTAIARSRPTCFRLLTMCTGHKSHRIDEPGDNRSIFGWWTCGGTSCNKPSSVEAQTQRHPFSHVDLFYLKCKNNKCHSETFRMFMHARAQKDPSPVKMLPLF